ncbi:uncharacterized protein LOC132295920 [Cornus florida]|uniref:uncharacterized protein LOC132295920 n=1 Tax=Cornus florida TaxID=4283 RepID=UPI002899B480|nr:uncharacterized protein LOC132295920 [Cornus florida]
MCHLSFWVKLILGKLWDFDSIWKSRNAWVFQQKWWDPKSTLDKALDNFSEFLEVCSRGLLSQVSSSLAPVPVRWSKPHQGKFKLNVDAAFCESLKVAGGGLVLRDDVGRPIKVVSLFLEFISDVEVAEAMVVREGLYLLSLWGYQDVEVESDCLNVSNFSPSNCRSAILVEDIRCLLGSNLGFSLGWAPRSCNRIAHLLSKWALSTKCNDFLWPVWLVWLLSALEADLSVVGASVGEIIVWTESIHLIC